VKRREASNDSLEGEHSPSPRKSPVKRRVQITENTENDVSMTNVRPQIARAESSRNAEMRQSLFTPQPQKKDLGLSLYTVTKPERSSRRHVPPARRQQIPEDPFSAPRINDRVTKARSKTPHTVQKSAEEAKKDKLEAQLWSLCGEDVDRWNSGDFGGFFKMKAARW